MLLQTIGASALVVSLMLGIGLELSPQNFAALWARPRILVLTVLVNLVAIPGLAWALIVGLSLPREVAIGVMLCAAAPGGPTSALFANMARADLALAAGMTILLPAIGVIATPMLLSLAVDLPAGVRVPALPLIATLIVLQIVPLGLGMLVRRRKPALAGRLAPWARRLANVILALLLTTLLALKGELMFTLSAMTWLTLLALSAAGLGLGWLAAYGEPSSARAGALVAMCRNISVSIMLASTFFVDPMVDATVLSSGFMAFVVPLGLAQWWRRGERGPLGSSAC